MTETAVATGACPTCRTTTTKVAVHVHDAVEDVSECCWCGFRFDNPMPRVVEIRTDRGVEALT